MLRNYLKIALRNLRKQAGYSLINIGGLGLGLACSFLIVLFVQHERSFDRFHEQRDRIYRIVLSAEERQRSAISASGFAPDLKAAFPEIAHAVRIENHRAPYLQVGSEVRVANGFAFADPAFFEVFSFPLLRGDPATVLENPYSVVLTESAARSLFGSQDPVGQVFTYNNAFDLTVTGVMEDVPPNSHLQFSYLGSFEVMPELMGEDALHNYTNYNYNTYVMLVPGADPAALEGKLPEFVRNTLGDEADVRLHLQPLLDIHFTTDILYDVPNNRDKRYLYMFSAIAFFILLIACINFMNLATARAAKRAKEVGVRKVVGAQREQLIGQFLGESVMLSVMAIVLALVLVLLCLPFFNELVDADARFGAGRLGTVALLVGIGLLTGIVAGSYPALYLSAYRPAHVLKGGPTQGRQAALLRKGLIVVQFAISVFLLIGTFTVYEQLRYMRSRDLGFDQEQVVFMSLTGPLQDNYDAFREELLRNPRVLAVTRTGGLPGRVGTNRGYKWPGQGREAEEQGASFYTITADPGYLETLGLTLKAGRNFSWDRESDWEDTYILNETAARVLGWEDPVGQPFKAWDRPEMGRVIGVVEDFHFKSLHQAIEPVVLNMKPWFGTVAVRLAPEDLSGAVAYLQRQWQTFSPGYPFSYTFLDADFDRLYRAEEQLAQRFGFFAFIAIFIACLGLFGLAAYSAEQRTKEIGVRKVLGASMRSIMLLLSREFTLLVAASFALAAPLAYLAMDRWLSAFAYHVTLGPGIFVLAAVIALAIAWLTVSYQSLKAALTNPVKALRYE